jgi:S1-C subfamily serine protease
MDPEPAALIVTRDGTRITYDITYADHDPNQVNLELTRHEFNALLPQLFKGLALAPAMKDTKVIGARIVSVDATHIFALMNFKAEDVVTEVDGQPVTNSNLAKALDGESTTLNIHFIRDGAERTLSVTFAQ